MPSIVNHIRDNIRPISRYFNSRIAADRWWLAMKMVVRLFTHSKICHFHHISNTKHSSKWCSSVWTQETNSNAKWNEWAIWVMRRIHHKQHQRQQMKTNQNGERTTHHWRRVAARKSFPFSYGYAIRAFPSLEPFSNIQYSIQHRYTKLESWRRISARQCACRLYAVYKTVALAESRFSLCLDGVDDWEKNRTSEDSVIECDRDCVYLTSLSRNRFIAFFRGCVWVRACVCGSRNRTKNCKNSRIYDKKKNGIKSKYLFRGRVSVPVHVWCMRKSLLRWQFASRQKWRFPETFFKYSESIEVRNINRESQRRCEPNEAGTEAKCCE